MGSALSSSCGSVCSTRPSGQGPRASAPELVVELLPSPVWHDAHDCPAPQAPHGALREYLWAQDQEAEAPDFHSVASGPLPEPPCGLGSVPRRVPPAPLGWSNGEGSCFTVRAGPGYRRHGLKACSGEAMYEGVGADVLRSDKGKVERVVDTVMEGENYTRNE